MHRLPRWLYDDTVFDSLTALQLTLTHLNVRILVVPLYFMPRLVWYMSNPNVGVRHDHLDNIERKRCFRQRRVGPHCAFKCEKSSSLPVAKYLKAGICI